MLTECWPSLHKPRNDRLNKMIACFGRLDSRERCEVKMIAFFTSHRSPLSERLEQANKINEEK